LELNVLETARELLTLAAVAGRRFAVDLLLQITRQTEDQFLRLLKELIATQLVVEAITVCCLAALE